MARYLSRIATRMWLLAALMTSITLAVGITSFYVANYFELYRARDRMPPRFRAELDQLIATGQRGSDRYYELFDRYTGDDLRSSDLPFLLVISIISTTIGGGAAFVFARRLSRPITDVAQAASRVASGDRSVRVDDENASGETGELVRSFNRMAADIEAYERERTVLTAGIAHELRTPLTILRGRLHALNDGVIEPSTGEADRLLRQVDALGRLVEDLRTLAHADAGELKFDLRQGDLAHVARTVADDLKAQADAANVLISADLKVAPVYGDPLRLAQIVTNLLTNAIKHAPQSSTVTICTWLAEHKAILEVMDEGDGFLESDRQRMFVPFWRAGADRATARPGSGMGLALALKLAEAHGGTIGAENRSGRSGARFWLSLPGARDEPAKVRAH